MARKKLKKLLNVDKLPNVFRIQDENALRVIKSIISDERKIVIEIGCGHGDYTAELASENPNIISIGVDLKGARIHTAAKRALDLNLSNAFFIIGNAALLPQVFNSPLADQIIIPFPDPHVKRKSENRRLVSSEFLSVYSELLKKDGKVHLKTDNEFVFNYALKSINENGWKVIFSSEDISAGYPEYPILNIRTKYEVHYLSENRKIKYICFQKI